MTELRKERIGLSHAARMLNVRITDLKEAISLEKPLQGDVMPPKPIGRFTTRKGMLFLLGDVMDCEEALKMAHDANKR
ncbi:MAG: hypothetical protein GX771_10785 [Halomonadaceae bacterium]|nr:hypothetical protein [Halomonadaceae bacterium]